MKLQAYKVGTAAELLDCKPSTIYRMIKEGRLRAIKLGYRNFRIPAAEIERLNGGEQGGAHEANR